MALLVNGERIDDAALREERRSVRRLLAEHLRGEDSATIEDRAREWARENLIERVLLKQAALRDPAPISAEAIDEALKAASPESRDQPGCRQSSGDAEFRRDAEVRLRIERFLAGLVSHVARPRHKDIVEHYRKNRESFHSPEAVRARHIIKNVDEQNSEESARNAMEQIRLALQEGASFEKLADELSDCPGRGGDLGYFTRGQMVPEFEGVAFGARVGEVSGIFRTPFGFHIVKVEDRRAEGILPLDMVSARIEEDLFTRKKQKAVEQYLDGLRAKADVRETEAIP